ncbi:Ig-like domain-containing protein [Glaciecola sp. MF2-115]|uniref:Ig-like domain-containing protein n=1 Tax=Glaciecola sp. MF2-115 TaxID=3384827 RepID=UPI00399F4995
MKALIKFLAVCTTSIMLFACGGGDSLTRDGSGTGGGTTPDPDPVVTYSVAVSIADAQGNAVNEVSEGNPLVITTTVTATNGGAVNDVLVTFSLSTDTLASFDNDTGTALTDANGVAVIGLVVGESRGDGVVSATIDAGASGTVGFSSAGTQQTQVVPASLELFASQIQMVSSGEEKVELIAVVKNEQNVLLEGVAVSFSADNGASIENVVGISRADGKATATLTTENNKINREINVTASTSTLSDSLVVEVVGTRVDVNGANSVIINDTATITINLFDSFSQGISGQELTLTTTIGELDKQTVTTGPNGQATVVFEASSAGEGLITATVADPNGSFKETSGTHEVVVQQDDFTFSSLPDEEIPLGDNQDISVRWFKNNAANVGANITLTTSRGTIAVPTVATDANGIATFSISSDFAGPASISAISTEADADGNRVSARANIEFIAEVVESVFVDATPDLIGPDGQTSTISAVVRDPSGNLVKGKVVDFTLIDSSGGSIFPNSAETGSNGVATTVYTSNAVSPENGVIVEATADSVTGSVELTVGDRAFDISIGTGNEVISQDGTTYIKEFAVFVSDSVGRPVENASLTASATPVKFVDDGRYFKGLWSWNDILEVWQVNYSVPEGCLNEDLNNNGRLDAGEDTNGDDELTPGIVGTISFKGGVAQTDASGQVTLELRYPKQFAVWTGVEVTVFGQSSGSEARDSQTLTLPIASTDVNREDSMPPANPFGSSTTCSNAN